MLDTKICGSAREAVTPRPFGACAVLIVLLSMSGAIAEVRRSLSRN